MKHIPFDYCDECGGKFPIEELESWLCEECRLPSNWKPAKHPDDDYDRTAKDEDDQ